MQTKHDYLSVADAAKRVGVSPDTLRRWESEGLITAVRTPTNHRRYLAADVDALLTGGDA